MKLREGYCNHLPSSKWHFLKAFGSKLVKLELTNCTNFTSGTALNLRKYCAQLRHLRLEVDSADGDTGGGLEGVGEQNIQQLEHQVSSLQERLNTLQVLFRAGNEPFRS